MEIKQKPDLVCKSKYVAAIANFHSNVHKEKCRCNWNNSGSKSSLSQILATSHSNLEKLPCHGELVLQYWRIADLPLPNNKSVVSSWSEKKHGGASTRPLITVLLIFLYNRMPGKWQWTNKRQLVNVAKMKSAAIN